jgi:flagellar hook-length control protein FliK
MMAAGNSMRVGAAQAAAAKPAGTGAATPGGNFQALLSTAPTTESTEVAIELQPDAEQGGDTERTPQFARDGIAELLAGLLTGIAAAPAGGDGTSGEGAAGEGEGEGAAPVDAAGEFLLTQPGIEVATASQEELLLAAASGEADAPLDDLIDAILPQLSAVAGDASAAAAADPVFSGRSAINGAGEPVRVLDAGSGVAPAASPSIHAPTAASPLASNPTPGPGLRSALGTPRWADELGNRIVLMTARGQQEGSLSLTPEHLGPVEVRISVIHNTASVWFGAQHADTRAALAEAMPRLREMFSDAGLALGHADVSHEAPRRQAAESRGSDPSMRTDAAAAEAAVPPAIAGVVSSALLDLYA